MFEFDQDGKTWVKLSKTWVGWTYLRDGDSIKYSGELFTKPDDGERLKNTIDMVQRSNESFKSGGQWHLAMVIC